MTIICVTQRHMNSTSVILICVCLNKPLNQLAFVQKMPGQHEQATSQCN